MAWFGSKVAVTLIDVSTGEVIGRTEISPSDLPETFAVDTTLHLAGSDWSVVEATPQNRADYEKTKTLTLRLSRIEKIDPHDILFSLPSICDYIPPVADNPLTGDGLDLAEDDWRQFELVSRQLAADTTCQLEAIRKIHETESTGAGWRKIHVRKSPDPPIVVCMPLAEVYRKLGTQSALSGVTYYGASSPIKFGFSFIALDGQRFYGLAPQEMVSVLAWLKKICQIRLSIPLGL